MKWKILNDYVNLPFNNSGCKLSCSNVANENKGEFGSLRSTTNAWESRNPLCTFFANNESAANVSGASVCSCSWLNELDCSETGVGGSDIFLDIADALLFANDGLWSNTGGCCVLLWLFNGPWLNVVELIVTVPIGCCCCICELPAGWFTVEFGEVVVLKLVKENRGGFDNGFPNWTDEATPVGDPCINVLPNGDPLLA